MKPLTNHEPDLENGRLERNREKTLRNSSSVVKVPNRALLAGLAYCVSSCSMILVNKFVLSSYDFNAGISLMLYQVVLIIYFLFCWLVVVYELKLLILDSGTFAAAEFHFRYHCLYIGPSWSNIDRTTNMEIG